MDKMQGNQLIVRLTFLLLFLDIGMATIEDAVEMPLTGFLSLDQKDWHPISNWFPLIRVELLYGNKINATQTESRTDPPPTNCFIYSNWLKFMRHRQPVRLNYITKGGTSGWVFMNKTEVIFDIALHSTDDWIVFNYDSSAHCNVMYDDILWDRITKQLNDNHKEFSDEMRVRLFENSYSLAAAGQSGFDRVLGLISLASKDRGWVTWFQIYHFASYFRSLIFGTTIYSDFESFMLNVINPLVDEIDFSTPRTIFDVYVNPRLWSLACSLGHKGCIANMTRLFQGWIKTGTKENPYQQDTDLGIGMANSLLESDWNTTFERYQLMPKDKRIGGYNELLHVLSCSRNVTLLERLLEFSAENIDTDYAQFYETMANIDRNPESNNTCWKWLKLNSAKIEERSTPGSSRLYLSNLARSLNTRGQRQEVVDFLDKYPFAQPNHTSKVLRTIDRNIRWMDKTVESIGQWLRKNAS